MSVAQGEKHYELTKKLVTEAYLGLKRLAEKGRFPECPQAKKRQRHEVWGPVLAPKLGSLLERITGRDMSNVDPLKIWNDCFDIGKKFLDLDAETLAVFFREAYDPCGSDCTELSESSKTKLEKFRQQGGLRQIDPDAFSRFQFSLPVANLMEQSRTQCANCNRKVHVYCPWCLTPISMDPPFPTSLQLPVKVDIVRHPREKVKKSTGLHAAVVAPEFVRHFEFPNVPELNPDTSFILYPTPDAPFLDELDLSQVETVVIIENTWSGSKRILEHENMRNLRPVKIRNEVTLYWRHQEVGNECLATIEAIYYFFVQHWKASNPGEVYNGEYDDLLLLYAHDFTRVMANNTPRPPKAWNLSSDPRRKGVDVRKSPPHT